MFLILRGSGVYHELFDIKRKQCFCGMNPDNQAFYEENMKLVKTKPQPPFRLCKSCNKAKLRNESKICKSDLENAWDNLSA
jgi:hypothetical protein